MIIYTAQAGIHSKSVVWWELKLFKLPSRKKIGLVFDTILTDLCSFFVGVYILSTCLWIQTSGAGENITTPLSDHLGDIINLVRFQSSQF